jgi:inner membrane protein
LDTVTHGLIGALASRTGFYQKTGRVATVAFTVGAVFPDIDLVVSFFGPDFSLRYHRGITHSAVVAPFFALLLGTAIYRFSSFKNLRTLALMVALGIYSHIFFDLITSYGIVVFDPLSMKRYSWNLVFILDPFITLPVLIGLVLAWRKKRVVFKVSIIVFTFLSLYLLFCLYAKELNSGKLSDFAKENSLDVLKSSIYPRPFAPLFWMGVIETSDAFYKVNISLFREDPGQFERTTKSEDNHFVKLAKGLRVTKLYFWFADFPVARYKNENGKHIVEFYDLRFGMIPNRTPFLLKIIFNGNGALDGVSLNGRTVRERF